MITASFIEVNDAARGKWTDILPALTNVAHTVFSTPKGQPCPFPGCKTQRDGFRYDNIDGNGTFFCNGCGNGNGITFIARARGIANSAAKNLVAEHLGLQQKNPFEGIQKGDYDTLINTWAGCQKLVQKEKKNIGQKYLESRGISSYDHLEQVVAYNPELALVVPIDKNKEPDNNKKYRIEGYYPALVARYLLPDENKDYVCMGHAWIYLTPEATKMQWEGKDLKRFRSRGRESTMSGAAIYLDLPEDGVIGVAEGLETALYCRQYGKVPMWACGTATLMDKVTIPENVHTVLIFADNDGNKLINTGKIKSESLAKRLLSEGKKVKIITPKEDGDDWLDAKNLTPQIIEEAELIESINYFYPEPGSLINAGIVRDIPLELLPKILRQWASDISIGLQIPISFPAASIVIMLATAICAGVAIKPKRFEPWFEFANLFGILIAPPSDKKSKCIEETFGPLYELEDAEEEAYKKAILRYGSDVREWEENKDALQKQKIVLAKKAVKKAEDIEIIQDLESQLKELEQNPPDKPIQRVFTITDSTPEAFVDLSKDNPRGFGIVNDELITLFDSFEREGRELLRQYILSSYTGGRSSQRRVGNSRKMKDSYITVFGGMQPDVFLSLLRKERKRNDGMMTRFQLNFITEQRDKKSLDRERNLEYKQQLKELIKKIAYTDFVQFGAIVDDTFKRPYFTTDDKAYQFFMAWEQEQLERLKGKREYTQSVIGRQSKLLLSLALIFHIVMVVSGERPKGPVGMDSMTMAQVWIEIIEEHAAYIDALMDGGNIGVALRVLTDKLKYGELSKFTFNKLIAYGWDGVDASKKEAVYDAIDQLLKEKWIFKEEVQGGKAGTYLQFTVNPRVVLK